MISLIKTKIKDLTFVLFYLMRIFPIKSNKIVFSNFIGKGCGDNPKYICEELIKMNEEFDLVWLTSNSSSAKLPTCVRAIDIKSVRAIYELSTAKVWIDNCRKGLSVRKRSGQYYIQTWHSGIGPKKIEKAAIKTLPAHYIKEAKHDSTMIDLMLAGSDWERNNIYENFWYNGSVLKIGLPRQDIFWENSSKKKSAIKNVLALDSYKVFIYAPTFRRTFEENIRTINIDWERILEALTEKFGGMWVGALRLHPNVAYMSKEITLPKNVIDLSLYDDPQELVVISDAIISDYSSIIYESAMINIPSFVFADSLASQNAETTFSTDDLPFPIALNFDELIENIRQFDMESYKEKCNTFFFVKCGVVKNNSSSKDIANIIKTKCFK